MKWLVKIWDIIIWPYEEYLYRRKMKKLRKEDPHIYK